MTTKEAAEHFNLSEKVVRTLCKEKKILGVTKPNGKYLIPDNTVMIVTDENARAFLLQLVKYKNNPGIILSNAGADTEEKLHTWHEYLLSQGLVGPCEFSANYRTLLDGMSLTDKGFDVVFGKQQHISLRGFTIEPAINVNIACLNA